MNIFIVENKELYIRMLDYIFSKSIHYRFYNYKNEIDCLNDLQMLPELLIIDSSVVHGVELIREVKKKQPEAHIIVMVKDETDIKSFLDAGVNEYVINSSGLKTIIEKVELFIENKTKEIHSEEQQFIEKEQSGI